PHHESEIAQANASKGHDPVKYWMHNNMITVNGQKMGKSLNNFITLDEFFSGNHPSLEKAYTPMTIRFFILQAQYRSTLDFSNEALQAAEKGMSKLFESFNLIDQLKPAPTSSFDINAYKASLESAMNDDFNTPIAMAHLFEISRMINLVNDGKEQLTQADIEGIKYLLGTYLFDVLGLIPEKNQQNDQLVNYLMDTILELRKLAKENKDWATSDRIRDELAKLNIQVKDTKEGARWSFK
ncbi:MAG: DALR domain-containing protein, partial [Bacteroidales bacterium]